VDCDGDKIGSIGDVYLDADSGRPEWIAVTTGLFGTKVSFVPIAEAREDGDDVRVPYEKSHVKDSPNVDADGALSQAEEERLYRHYDISYTDNAVADGVSGEDAGLRDHGTVGRDVSGPETDDAMTRSEEELDVGVRSRETGRARLRKYVVTEPVETTVQVQREEVRLEREPITDANRDEALAGGDITEEAAVDEQLRKERIETEGDVAHEQQR
jgi:stress response protein YsnF